MDNCFLTVCVFLVLCILLACVCALVCARFQNKLVLGGAALNIKQRDPVAQAELYIVGSSSIRPFYYRCTSPKSGGIVMTGKSISGLLKSGDSERKLLFDTLRRVRPKNILLSFGEVDLNYVYPFRTWVALHQGKTAPGSLPEDPLVFAKAVAEKYLKLLQIIHECHPANIYILLPNYSPLDDEQLRQSLIKYLKFFTATDCRKDLLNCKVMSFILSRGVRNLMVDSFNAQVIHELKHKKHFHPVDLNPYVSFDGAILSEYRMKSPTDHHLAVAPVLKLVKSLLPQLAC